MPPFIRLKNGLLVGTMCRPSPIWTERGMGDPLRTGRIFNLDPNLLKQMRPHMVSPRPPPQQSNPLDGFAREELVPGLKAKFDDVYRRTPNPMSALFGSPQSYYPQFNQSAPLHFASPPPSSSPMPAPLPQTPSSESRFREQVETSTPLVEAKEIALEAEDTRLEPENSGAAPEQNPLVSHSPVKQKPLIEESSTKVNPKSEEKVKTKLQQPAVERMASSEGKRPRAKSRPRGCDSLSLLFAPPSKPKQFSKDPPTKQNTSITALSFTTSSQVAPPKRSSVASETNHPIQQRLFSSPSSSKGSVVPTTPDKISKRTRSRTRPSESILSHLPDSKAKPQYSSSSTEADPSSRPQSVTAPPRAESKNLNQRGQRASVIPVSKKLKQRSQLEPEPGRATTFSSREKSQGRKQVRAEQNPQSHSSRQGQNHGGSEQDRQWRQEEILALQQAHRLCPVEAPDFWDLVAAKMSEVFGRGGSRRVLRTGEECSHQWYQVGSLRVSS
jgi:hypothetical protein